MKASVERCQPPSGPKTIISDYLPMPHHYCSANIVKTFTQGFGFSAYLFWYLIGGYKPQLIINIVVKKGAQLPLDIY